MKRTIPFLAAVAFCGMSPAYADYGVTDQGTWPTSWPKELEPLRKQARTYEGPVILLLHYVIPFTKRTDFESAWPHILKVKSQGAPVVLVRGPEKNFWAIPAGVRIHTPPRDSENRVEPETPIPGTTQLRDGWWHRTTYIELVVDGEIVDLNRIPLPAETPIIDKRFEDEPNRAQPKGSDRAAATPPNPIVQAAPPAAPRDGAGERSLEQRVADAQVIVVAKGLDSAPAPNKRPGELPERLIRFRVAHVLKGKLADPVITTRTPTAAAEFVGKEWVILLSDDYMAGKHRYADCNTINDEPEVKAILSKGSR